MSDPRPEELIRIEKLMNEAKYEEGLELVDNLENKEDISEDMKLKLLYLKGLIFTRQIQLNKPVEIGEQLYQLSQKSGYTLGVFEGLLLKSWIQFKGYINKGYEIVVQAEQLLESSLGITKEERDKHKYLLSFLKAYTYFFKGELDLALELATKNLGLAEKINLRYEKAHSLILLSLIYWFLGNSDQAKSLSEESLAIFTEIDDFGNVAWVLSTIGIGHQVGGEFNISIEYLTRSLEIKECPLMIKNENLRFLGEVYAQKGELNLALDYFQEASASCEKIGDNRNYLSLLYHLGHLCQMRGNLDRAVEYYEQALALGKEIQYPFSIAWMFYRLIISNLDRESYDQANLYLNQLGQMSREYQFFSQFHDLCKALILKKTLRISQLADAEKILKHLIKDTNIIHELRVFSLVNLCDLYLSELTMTNNSSILDELNPLITELLKIAEEQNTPSLIAETLLLQGRVALIKLNLDLARQFITKAQIIAAENEFNLLARKISHEHDKLLEELEMWETLKKTKASMKKRVELSAPDQNIDRMLEKQAVDPPELIEEEPILLIIMDNSGSTYFNYPFIANWDYSDLFSSFMSAFNTFSSEIFSKSIDRIRIGENTILINPVEPFLTCYVIKGQSYPALQKLSRFTEAIRENSEIWQALNKSVKTNEMLELDKPLVLKTVINEIFTQ